MTFFKKQFRITILLILLISPTIVQGAGSDLLINGAINVSDQAGLETQQKIPDLIGQVINALFGLVGVIFLGMAVIGGILWMMAGGNEEKVTRAKKFIIGGIEGSIILFLSYALIYFVLQALIQGVN